MYPERTDGSTGVPLIVGFADRLQATDYRLQCENLAWLSL
jgi:hypothetical protein